jgi:collagen type III alpha
MATDVKFGSSAGSRTPRNYENFVDGRLARVARRIRLLDLAGAALGYLAITFAYGLAMALLDRWLELSALARQLGFTAYLIACAAYLTYAFVVPLRRVINPYFAARQIETQIPDAKNSVVNWVDLRRQPLPPAFRHAIGHRAAKDLSGVDIDQVIQSPAVYWLGWATLALLGLVLLFYILSPRQLQSLLKRAFAPFTEASIATRTQITIQKPEERDVTIPIGHAISFSVWVDGRVPDQNSSEALKLLYRYSQSDPYEQRLLEAGESHRVWNTTMLAPDVHNGFWYKFTGGDAETAEHHVATRSAPLVANVDVTYHYRPYLKWPDRHNHDPNLQALEGTDVALTVHTNRHVREGSLSVKDGATVTGTLVPSDTQALRFHLVLEKDGSYEVSFLSLEGERNARSLPYSIRVEHDSPPQVEITQPGADVTLPANGVLRLAGAASDDFGLTSLVLRMNFANDATPLQPKPYREGKTLVAGDGKPPLMLDYRDFVELDKLKRESGVPLMLQAGQRLEYWLEATDNCDYPAPHTSASKHFFVTIGTNQDSSKQKQDVDNAKAEQREHEQEQDQKLQEEKRDEPKAEKPPQAGQQPDAKDPQQSQSDDEKKLKEKKQELEKLIRQNEKKSSENPKQQDQNVPPSPDHPDGGKNSQQQGAKEGGRSSQQNRDPNPGEKSDAGSGDRSDQKAKDNPANTRQQANPSGQKDDQRTDSPEKSSGSNSNTKEGSQPKNGAQSNESGQKEDRQPAPGDKTSGSRPNQNERSQDEGSKQSKTEQSNGTRRTQGAKADVDHKQNTGNSGPEQGNQKKAPEDTAASHNQDGANRQDRRPEKSDRPDGGKPQESGQDGMKDQPHDTPAPMGQKGSDKQNGGDKQRTAKNSSGNETPEQKEGPGKHDKNGSSSDAATSDKSAGSQEKQEGGKKPADESKENKPRGNEANNSSGQDQTAGTRPEEAKDGDKRKPGQPEDKSSARKNAEKASQEAKENDAIPRDKNEKAKPKESGKSQAPISSELKRGDKQGDGKAGSKGEKTKQKGASQQKGDQEGKESEENSGGRSKPGQTSHDKASQANKDSNQLTSGEGRQDTSLSSKEGQKNGGKATSGKDAASSNDANARGNVAKDANKAGDANQSSGDRDPGAGEEKASSGKKPPVRSKEKTSNPPNNKQGDSGQSTEPRAGTQNDSSSQQNGRADALRKMAQQLAEDLRSSDPQKRAQAEKKLEDLRRKLSEENNRRARDDAGKESGKDNRTRNQPGENSTSDNNRNGAAAKQQSSASKSRNETEIGSDGSKEASKKSDQRGKEGENQGPGSQPKSGEPTDGSRGGTPGSRGNRRPDGSGVSQTQASNADGGAQENQENPTPGTAANGKKVRAVGELQLEDLRKKVNKDILKQANMSEEDFKKFLKAYQTYLEKHPVTSEKEELIAPHRGNMAAPNQRVRQIDPAMKVQSGDPQRTGPALPPPQFREAMKEFSQRLSELNAGRDQK